MRAYGGQVPETAWRGWRRTMLSATESPLLTVAEAAARLRISKSAVYNLINRGELEVVQVYGRTRRVLMSSVDEWIERQRRGQ
jgi:excisionase family DNA binding protein